MDKATNMMLGDSIPPVFQFEWRASNDSLNVLSSMVALFAILCPIAHCMQTERIRKNMFLEWANFMQKLRQIPNKMFLKIEYKFLFLIIKGN